MDGEPKNPVNLKDTTKYPLLSEENNNGKDNEGLLNAAYQQRTIVTQELPEIVFKQWVCYT